MNKIQVTILMLGLSLCFCCGSKYKNYVKRSEKEHYWDGTKNGVNYKYAVDSIVSHFIFGRLIIDDKDILYLRGFEKGNLYPMWYLPIDSLAISANESCMLFFRYTSFQNDTLMLSRVDRDSSCNWIEEDVALIRRRKDNF